MNNPPLDQEAVIRQLIKDNLTLKAQVRTLTGVAFTISKNGPWSRDLMDYILAGPNDGNSVNAQKYLFQEALKMEIGESGLQAHLSEEEIKQLSLDILK